MPSDRPSSGFASPPSRALVKEALPLSGVYPCSPPVSWDAVHVCAWPDCRCCDDAICAKRMASRLAPHAYRPGAVHMRDADGWVSPFEAGDPRCPLSGVEAERTHAYPGLVWSIVFWLMILMLVGLTTLGMGYVLWVLIEWIGDVA